MLLFWVTLEPTLAYVLPYSTNHQEMTAVHPGLPNTRQPYIYIYIILYYIILYYIILYYTILYYIVLYYIILYYIILYYILFYYIILYYIILFILYYIILYYIILYYIILYYIILYIYIYIYTYCTNRFIFSDDPNRLSSHWLRPGRCRTCQQLPPGAPPKWASSARPRIGKMNKKHILHNSEPDIVCFLCVSNIQILALTS